MSCALDAGQSIAFSVGGTPYLDAGNMGVAPAWTTRALSASEAAWVSACVLARLNLTSTVVHISARGANAGYDTTITELADYAIEEGAFWGNVFTDVGAIAGFSCNGIDQAADDSYGDLPARACAQWDGVAGSNRSACGLTYVGLCTTACTTASPYANCASGGGARADAVVTSFLSGTAP
ncbi:MAG: hypothetical protein H7138_09100 [Myxococcales bacterium]|nr:hypothetical protein [Myxococcales bacterium]